MKYRSGNKMHCWQSVYYQSATENKHAKTHAVRRENVGLLHKIVGRLTPRAQHVTHNAIASFF